MRYTLRMDRHGRGAVIACLSGVAYLVTTRTIDKRPLHAEENIKKHQTTQILKKMLDSAKQV